jgi:hypothetical protein
VLSRSKTWSGHKAQTLYTVPLATLAKVADGDNMTKPNTQGPGRIDIRLGADSGFEKER